MLVRDWKNAVVLKRGLWWRGKNNRHRNNWSWFGGKKDRITEVACIELIDGKRTSQKYHSYFNSRPLELAEQL
ncbi:MAG: hypothetical protein ACKESB_01225 [Candidatus Hodgkinia cicadicola]